MPKHSYGPIKQKRARCLLEALLDYADNDLEVNEQLRRELKATWTKDDSALFIVGTLESLAELTKTDRYSDKLDKNHVGDAIAFLGNYLGILKQATKQGSAERNLTLTLWYRDKAKNLKSFDEECKSKDSKKTKQAWQSPTSASTYNHRSDSQPLMVTEQDFLEEQVELDFALYVERLPIEDICQQTILNPGSLIRIKAPQGMGKTSLARRVLAQASQQGYQNVYLSLELADGQHFANLDKFLRWFCKSVSRELGLQSQLDDYWDEDDGSKVNCTTYFEKYLLSQADSPLALCLDDVDLVFPHTEISEDFFGLLRFWHEKAKTRPIWKRLRLVVVHSTEDYLKLDINQSPFNVGQPIELSEFSPEQVQGFARQHQLDWDATQVTKLMIMVGGHPDLVQQAVSYLKTHRDITLDELLENAPTEAGIYRNHLRKHLLLVEEYPELAKALKKVVTATNAVHLESTLAYKLHSMGLVEREGNDVKPRCNLYIQYFGEHLGDT